MAIWEFDPNRPPPMPLSALLYNYHWMSLICRSAPWMVYPMMRHARRDALTCAAWLRFYVVTYAMAVRWAEINPALFVIRAA